MLQHEMKCVTKCYILAYFLCKMGNRKIIIKNVYITKCNEMRYEMKRNVSQNVTFIRVFWCKMENRKIVIKNMHMTKC